MASPTLTLTANVSGATALDLMGVPTTSAIFLGQGPDALQLPIPTYDETYADGPDTEGGGRVRSKPQNVPGVIQGYCRGSTSTAYWAAVSSLQQTVEQCRRSGGTLAYAPLNGTAVSYVLESIRLSEMPQRQVMQANRLAPFTLEFTARPYGNLATQLNYPLSDLDPFNRDTLTNQEWRNANTTTWVAGGGRLTPLITSFRGMQRAYKVEDATAYWSFTTGASVAATWDLYVVMKWLDSANMLFIGLDAAGLKITKVDVSVSTNLASTAQILSTTTNYWLKAVMVDNDITLSLYTTDPLGSSPTAAIKTLAHTLAGANATKFGVDVKGQPGLWATPKATDWSYGPWRLDSAWMETFDPQARFALLDMPGSVAALPTVYVTDQANQARRHVEVGLDDLNFDKAAPQPVLIESDVLQLVGAGAVGTHSGAGVAYDPAAAAPNVVTATLKTVQTTVCSTGQQQHIGARRIKARVYGNGNGVIYMRLAYKVGDGAWSRLDWVALPTTGNWFELNLGSIKLPDALVVNQTWEGRIEAFTAGPETDTLEIDFIQVLPARRIARARGQSDVGIKSLLAAERFPQGVLGDINGAAVGGAGLQSSYGSFSNTGIDSGGGGSVGWNAPGNIGAYDGNYAFAQFGTTHTAYAYRTTNLLKAHSFGFAIPAGATIQGIQLEIWKNNNIDPAVWGFLTWGDTYVIVQKGGVDQADYHTAQPSNWGYNSNTYNVYGGPNDKWGTTWTQADINASGTSGFGMRTAAFLRTGGATVGTAYNAEFRYEYVRMRVWYLDSAGATWSAASGGWIGTSADPAAAWAVTGGMTNTFAGMATGGKPAVVPAWGPYTTVGVASTVTKADQAAESAYWRGGILARAGNSAANALNDYLFAGFDIDYRDPPSTPTSWKQRIVVVKRSASGAGVLLGAVSFSGSMAGGRRIWLAVDAAGNFWVWIGAPGGTPTLVMTGQDSALATGGALASGRVGIYYHKSGSVTSNVYWDDLEVWDPDFSAPVIGTGGRLTIDHDAVFTPTGGRPIFDGAYPRLDPRDAELVVKARRQDVEILPDDGTLGDATRVAVDLTPRVALLGS